MRYLVFTFLLSFTSVLALAQAEFSFGVVEHDFGQIKEKNGPVEYKFIYENIGNEPLLIKKVDASCGCTIPEWTKEAVAPGQQGFILAKFNPKNRPGSFRKSLTVTSNSKEIISKLYIKGIVMPEPKDPTKEFPNAIGSLHSRYRSFQLGKITTEKPSSTVFPVYNNSENMALSVVNALQLPAHIQVSFVPEAIAPKSMGQLVISYDAAAKGDFGFVSDKVVLLTNDSLAPEKEFHVLATIQEFFPEMSEEEMANAPVLALDKEIHDYGKLKQAETVLANFVISNAGKTNLNIRTVKTNCNCAVAKLESNEIAPGESTNLGIEFNSTGRRGNQYKSITIFSNDPKNSTKRLVIKAVVEAESN